MARILLIEPNTILAKTYQAALQHAGHEVILTDNAQGAINGADQATPELVVMELQLTAHNGVEFLYEFRSYPDWQEVPVIIHSLIPKRAFDPGLALWRELNISDYLYKPQTSLHQLLRAVETCLAATLHEAA